MLLGRDRAPECSARPRGTSRPSSPSKEHETQGGTWPMTIRAPRTPGPGPAAGTGWRLAIDFGTTNTAAAMTGPGAGAPTVLEIDNRKYLPSVVYRDNSGELITGKFAVSSAATYPERAERVPKRALVTSKTVFLGGTAVPVIDLVAAVLRRVYAEAVRYQGGTAPAQVILTHPARWEEP